MFRITVEDRRGLRTFSFLSDVVTIGRGKERDLVLEVDTISRLHAEVRVDRGRGAVLLEDKSETGIFLHGERIEGVAVVDPEAWYVFGGGGGRGMSARIQFDDFELGDAQPAERDFLAMLRTDARDDVTRAVYADWLEEQGRSAHAEFLRTQIAARGRSATDPEFKAASARLLELAPQVEVAWRVRVAMAVVQACGEQVAGRPGHIAFELECTRRWDEMVPTATEGVRTCTACKKDVVYCTSIDQAYGWAEEGGCVAIDVAVSYAPGDRIGAGSMMRGRPAPNVASRGTKRV